MVTKQHLSSKSARTVDIERLETWIWKERIRINNVHNNICAKNTADNCDYLLNLLTSATAALAVIERLEAWIEEERSK